MTPTLQILALLAVLAITCFWLGRKAGRDESADEIARLTNISDSQLSDADWAQSFVAEVRAELNAPIEYVPTGRHVRAVK